MKPRTLILLIVAAAVVTFAALNWDAIMMPTNLTVGFTTFTAPIGLILLGVVAVVTLAWFSSIVWWRHAARRAAGEHARKMEAQRELVDRAEASRFVQLQDFLSAEMRAHEERERHTHAAIVSRLDRVETALRAGARPEPDDDQTAAPLEPVLADER